MKITIVVADKYVCIDDVPKTLDSFDWSAFTTVRAVQAMLAKDRAEIEYESIDPDGDGPLPAVKPPNEMIDAATFTERFGSIVSAWDAHQEQEHPEPVADMAAESLSQPQQQPDVIAQILHRLDMLDTQVAAFIKEMERGA